MPDPARPAAGSSLVRTEELAAQLDQLGLVLLASETVGTTVDLVIQLAADTIPATAGAGVTLVEDDGQRSVSASHTMVEQADALQYELGEGPCLTAWRDRVTVRIDDVAAEARWPAWTEAATRFGIRSMLSVPLVAGGSAIGAIKVYSYQRRAYDAQAERVLALFARHAAALLANSQTLTDARHASVQLTAALVNRDIIGQAKGVLIAQGAVDDQAAFAMLATASQRSNLKLSEVARQLVESVARENATRPTGDADPGPAE